MLLRLVFLLYFEAITPDVEGELQMGVMAASLAREQSWLPAVENRGEGVFLQFRKPSIAEWLARPEVQEHGKRLVGGFESWQGQHPQSRRHFPGLPCFLMHSISHLLLTAVALECGYPASSIRERVHALDAGYGILLTLARRAPKGHSVASSKPGARSTAISGSLSNWAGCARMTRSAPSTTRKTRTNAASCTARPATGAC